MSLSVNTKPIKAARARALAAHTNTSLVDRWSFKGAFNFTKDPAAVNAIPADGAVVTLRNNAGDALNQVTFTGAECDFAFQGRRVVCKQAAGRSRMSLVQQPQKGIKAASAIWRVSGHFSKVNVVGNITNIPLGVMLTAGITYVDR